MRYAIVNVSQLERFDDGATIGLEQLSDAGLIKNIKSKVKILDIPLNQAIIQRVKAKTFTLLFSLKRRFYAKRDG